MCYNDCMDDIGYLNQIAKDNRVAQVSADKDRLFDPKWIKLIIGAVVAVILMMIIGGILGNLGHGQRDSLDRVYMRAKNLNETIQQYNSKVKSSELRAMGNSLSTVLSETTAKVTALLASEYDAKGAEPQNEKIANEEEEEIAEVRANLEYGRMNGFLDRYFVREMSREIVLLMSLETETIDRTSSSAVKEAMAGLWNNLKQLSSQFENYQSLVD